jgi:hypothetical protein
MKTFTVSCDNRHHACKNWIYKAENEQDAWSQFIKARGDRNWKNIEITEIKKP